MTEEPRAGEVCSASTDARHLCPGVAGSSLYANTYNVSSGTRQHDFDARYAFCAIRITIGGMAADDPRDVYFEFTAIGGFVKVVAIDAATGTEVSVTGPVNAAQSDLQRLAMGKLKARLKRDAI